MWICICGVRFAFIFDNIQICIHIRIKMWQKVYPNPIWCESDLFPSLLSLAPRRLLWKRMHGSCVGFVTRLKHSRSFAIVTPLYSAFTDLWESKPQESCPLQDPAWDRRAIKFLEEHFCTTVCCSSSSSSVKNYELNDSWGSTANINTASTKINYIELFMGIVHWVPLALAPHSKYFLILLWFIFLFLFMLKYDTNMNTCICLVVTRSPINFMIYSLYFGIKM